MELSCWECFSMFRSTMVPWRMLFVVSRNSLLTGRATCHLSWARSSTRSSLSGPSTRDFIAVQYVRVRLCHCLTASPCCRSREERPVWQSKQSASIYLQEIVAIEAWLIVVVSRSAVPVDADKKTQCKCRLVMGNALWP